MEDTSLTDFLDAGEEADDESSESVGADTDADPGDVDVSDDEDGSGDGKGTDDANGAADLADGPGDAAATDGTDVTPATSTAAWSPGTATCEDCGAATAWRYRDGDAMVCPDCKSW